ncbi:hypothetical protein B0H16DRAFT_1475121 [Mycena metata]|uniref:Uncharacterized protein n=1 Tax=Mycena metata TaxID=1033252 RepID=A0AAD7HET7_9AGAR|nr:hypothetical protein B0H16DRAFT_1475121 [Mycena metata]
MDFALSGMPSLRKFCLVRPAAQDHEGWSAIPRSATGIPLFPTVDFDNTTRAGLAQIADLFLKVSWDHTWPSDKVYTTLPYDQLTKHPDDFYDTQQYTFRLNIPLAEMSLSQLSRIIEDLITISTTDSPFVFREKRDILARRQSRTCSPSLPPAPVPIVPPPPPPSTETQTLPLVPPASKAAPANPTLPPPPPPPSTETQTPAPATSTAAPPSAEDLTPPPPPPSTETQTAPPVPPASTAATAAVEDPTFPPPPPPSTNAVKKPVRGKGQKRTAAVAFGADADPGADSADTPLQEAREERAQVAAAAHAKTAAKVKTTKWQYPYGMTSAGVRVTRKGANENGRKVAGLNIGVITPQGRGREEVLHISVTMQHTPEQSLDT